MHVFFLTEAFTIIEAIHYVIENDIKDADAYVIKVFEHSEEVAKKLKETHIFKNVYIWDDVLLTYPITIKKCINVVLNGKRLVKFMKDKKYDYAYYNNGGWLVNSIFYTGVVQNNKDAVHIYLEHVSLTYITAYNQKSWALRAAIRLVGLHCMDGSMLESIRLFEPDILQVDHGCSIKKLPKMNKNNPRLKEILNYIFGYDEQNDDIKNKKIVIMEQPPYQKVFDVEKFWNKILGVLDLDQVVVKAHPRQKQSVLNHTGVTISRNHTIPWEINLLNEQSEEKIQIAIFSGSCTSPKLMFDDEPIIILLYKLLPIDYTFLGEGILKFSESVADKYADRSRFFVPETFEEFKEYCEKIGIGKKNF